MHSHVRGSPVPDIYQEARSWIRRTSSALQHTIYTRMVSVTLPSECDRPIVHNPLTGSTLLRSQLHEVDSHDKHRIRLVEVDNRDGTLLQSRLLGATGPRDLSSPDQPQIAITRCYVKYLDFSIG